MPAYNSGKYIGEAIESLIAQTYEDWELIVVNDGSKDNTAEVISSFKDERIRFINHEENHGFIPTLNYAIKLSKGEYIARLDDDDISYPERFEKQVAFLEEHKDVLLVGGRLDVLKNGEVIEQARKPFVTSEELQFCLLFENLSFGHSSFMFRRSVFEEHGVKYDTFLQVPDHHIQLDVCQKGKLGIVDELVFTYRLHDTQSTAIRSIEMKQTEEDKCRMIYVDEIELEEEYKSILKKAICRELKTLEDYKRFNQAVLAYGKFCGMPQNKEEIKINEAYAYAYDSLIVMQKRSIMAFLGYLQSPFKKTLKFKKYVAMILGRNKFYIKPFLDYTMRYDRTIFQDIEEAKV